MVLNSETTHAAYVIRIPLGVVSSLLLGVVWLSPYIEQPQVEGDKYGVMLFGLAAVIELSAEPLWVWAQLQQHVSLKVEAVIYTLRGAQLWAGSYNTPSWMFTLLQAFLSPSCFPLVEECKI